MKQSISQRMKAIPAEHYLAFRSEVISLTGYSSATYHNIFHGKTQPRYDKGLIIARVIEKFNKNFSAPDTTLYKV